MFEHSLKVPRLYKVAAKIAERVKLYGESVKQVYDDKLKHLNTKALYALIVSTVQNDSNLEFLLKKSELLQKENRLEPWLTKVLITELLWGKKRLSGNSKPVQTVLAYEQIFNAHLNELEQPRNKIEKVDKPRYVRVNTLKISVHEAVDAFRDEGWTLVKFLDKEDYPGFLTRISNLEEDEFMVDIHVPYVLIFPPRTEFFNHGAYKDGLIALQDKASCLPAHILNPSPGSKVLDMCAAPGMKTTQMACIMNGSGVIHAVERDLKRAVVLRGMIEASGAQDCVQVVERDVLDVCKRKTGLILDADKAGKFKESEEKEEVGDGTHEDDVYRDVDYILVDPSCSGSGMVMGPERIGNFRTDQSRLKRLAGFQIMILKHALRAFPSAKRVVYSTCSLNIEENEEVVQDVLQSNHNFKLVDVKTLCSPWVHFGSDSFGEIGSYCLYSRPDEDMTNGFFVAVFDRLESGEENKFLLKREPNTFRKDFHNSETIENEDESMKEVDKVNQNRKSKQKQDRKEYDEIFCKGTNQSLHKEHEIIELKDNNQIKEMKKKKKLNAEKQKLNISSEMCVDNIEEHIPSKQNKKKKIQEIIEEEMKIVLKHTSDDGNCVEVTKNSKKKKQNNEGLLEVDQQFQKKIKKKKKILDDSRDNVDDSQNISIVLEMNYLQNDEKKKNTKKSKGSLVICDEECVDQNDDNSSASKQKKIKKEKRKREQQAMGEICTDKSNEENINCTDIDTSVIVRKRKKEKIQSDENKDADINNKGEQKKSKKRQLEEINQVEENEDYQQCTKKIKRKTDKATKKNV